MATTPWLFMTNVNNPPFHWTDESNVLQEADFAQCDLRNQPSGFQSEILATDTPVAGDSIPDGSVIDEIHFEVSYQQTITSNDYLINGWRITGGSTIDNAIFCKSSQNSVLFEQNIAFWGLTAQEAWDFMKGNSSDFTFYMERATGDTGELYGRIYFIKCRAVYTPPPNTEVRSPPVIF
jgi:hypothetical protein